MVFKKTTDCTPRELLDSSRDGSSTLIGSSKLLAYATKSSLSRIKCKLYLLLMSEVYEPKLAPELEQTPI